MTKAYQQMSVDDALYTAARKYPGSIEALAPRMDISAKVLRNKLTPDIDTHHISLEEALQVIEHLDATKPHAADLAIKAIAYRLGRVVVRHSGIDSDQSAIEIQALAVAGMVGMLAADVAVAMQAKGGKQVVTKKEADAIKADIGRALDALFLLADSIDQRTENK